MGNGIDPEEQIDVDMLSATPPYSMAALPPLPEDSRPLGVRRARREDRQMPMRYRDILPHPPPHLPPQEIPNVFVQWPAGMEIPKNCSEMRCLPQRGGNHFYDKNQAVAWKAMCIMPRGSMRSLYLIQGDFNRYFI